MASPLVARMRARLSEWRNPNKRMLWAWRHLGLPFRPVLLHDVPRMLLVETTNLCNLSCAHCARRVVYGARNRKACGCMEWQLWKRIVDEIARYPGVTLRPFGEGEPLLHPQLPALIEYAKAQGVSNIWLNTNGTLLTEERSKSLLEAGLDQLEVSIDAYSVETYEKIKGRPLLAEVTSNALRYIELKERILPHGKVVASFVESDLNAHETHEFAEFWEHHADAVHIRPVHQHGSHVGDDAGPGGSSAINRLPCPLLWGWAEIDFQGNLRFCIWDWEGEGIVANVKKAGIAETWTGSEYRALRGLHTQGRFDEIPICGRCKDHKHWRW